MIGHPCPAGAPEWWASFDGGEHYSIGPCDTREQVIEEAMDDGCGEYEADPGVWRNSFTIALCARSHVDLSRKFDANDWLERLEECMDEEEGADENGDHHPLSEITPDLAYDLEASIRSAIWHWQNRKGLKLQTYWFGETSRQEEIDLPCASPVERELAANVLEIDRLVAASGSDKPERASGRCRGAGDRRADGGEIK